MASEIDITITRGKTFEFAFLYAEDDLLYLPISGMPSKAPCRLTIAGHGIPDGWPVQVQGCKTPVELNTQDGESLIAKVIDANTIEFNAINASAWKALSGPGVVVLNKPLDLTGWQCRAQVRDRVGGELLFSWHSDPAESPDGEAEVDVAACAFVLKLSAEQAAALDFKRGLYDAEAVSPTGEVYPLTAISQVTVEDEVTA